MPLGSNRNSILNMKRYYIYIITVLAAAFCATGVSAQTREKPDTVAAFSWSDVKTFSEATGSFKTVGEQDLEKRGMGDLRNMLTGMVPGLYVTEDGGSFFSAATGSFATFGLGGGGNTLTMKGTTYVYCLVDDVPIPFNQIMLDPNQIESITVLDNVLDKAKAGPIAGTGAILIKTKKGSYNTPLKVNVDFEGGVNMIDLIPEWCTGAEYAQLNNYARAQSGMLPLYSDEAIDAFRARNPYDLAYPCVDYRSLMIKDMFDMERFGVRASAGSNNIKYNVSVNGLHSGDITNSGNGNLYRLNATANVSTKIGKYIEASAAFTGLVTYRYVPNYSWANFFSVPECAYPLILDIVGEDEEDVKMIGRTIYGVSDKFTNNYYAQMKEGGFYMHRNRSGVFSAAVDVDFSWLLPGLKARTQVQETSFIYSKIGKSNQYIANLWTSEMGMGVRSADHVGTTATSRSTASSNISQSLNIAEDIFYDWAKNGHKVHADAVFSLTDFSQTGDSHRQRLIALNGGARYSYKDRYVVEAAAEYAGSPRYMKGSRWGLFPTVGLAWNLNNEPFLKDVDFIDVLKIRGQFGEVPLSNNVFGTQYLYQAQYSYGSGNVYGPVQYGGNRWFGVNQHTSTPSSLSRMAADDLTWERIKQLDLGFDADLFGCLRIGAEYYMYDRYGLIVDANAVLPEVYGIGNVTLYKNYQSTRCKGWDVNLQFHKRVGDWFFTAGGFCGAWDTIYTKLVDDDYLYEYQKKTGYSTSVIRAFECIGRYQDQEQIDALPSYVTKDQLSIGDLIYKDLNDDGVIDTNDKKIIGTTQPKLNFAVNVGLQWKNLDFQVVGTGILGYDYNLQGNGYFTRGEGDENLSAFVRDGLISGEYPSLSYYQSKNNFVASSFWLRNCNWFKIQHAELGYNFKFKKDSSIQGLRLALKGENLLTFTNMEYIDPEAHSAGISAYPLLRTFTLGAKFTF